MRALLVCGLLAAARLCTCADLSGDWIAVVNANHADPVYARVQLTVKNGTVSGSWSQMTVQGKLTGIKLQIVLLRDTVPMGTLTGALTAQGCSGEGQMNGSANEGSSTMESVTWSLTRPARPPAGGPRTIDFEPSTFHGYYSASLAPVLHIFPGTRSEAVPSTPVDEMQTAAVLVEIPRPVHFLSKGRCRVTP